jgi:translation initiation factor IF-2
VPPPSAGRSSSPAVAAERAAAEPRARAGDADGGAAPSRRSRADDLAPAPSSSPAPSRRAAADVASPRSPGRAPATSRLAASGAAALGGIAPAAAHAAAPSPIRGPASASTRGSTSAARASEHMRAAEAALDPPSHFSPSSSSAPPEAAPRARPSTERRADASARRSLKSQHSPLSHSAWGSSVDASEPSDSGGAAPFPAFGGGQASSTAGSPWAHPQAEGRA